MKKNISIFLFLLVFTYFYSENKIVIPYDSYLNNGVTINNVKYEAIQERYGYLINLAVNFAGKVFEVNTLLVDESEKSKYLSFEEIKDKDILMLTKEDYEMLVNKLDKNDKGYIINNYRKFGNYFILAPNIPQNNNSQGVLNEGISISTANAVIRSIIKKLFKKVGFVNKSFVYEVKYNGLPITGKIYLKKKKMEEMKINNTEIKGLLHYNKASYTINNKDFYLKFNTLLLSYEFLINKKESFYFNLDIKEKAVIMTLPDLTDEEIAVLYLYYLLYTPIYNYWYENRAF